MLAGLSTSNPNFDMFPTNFQSIYLSQAQAMTRPDRSSDRGKVRFAEEKDGYAFDQKLSGGVGNSHAVIEHLMSLMLKMSNHKAGHTVSIEQLEKTLAYEIAEQDGLIFDDEATRQLRSASTKLATELKSHKDSYLAKVEDMEKTLNEHR